MPNNDDDFIWTAMTNVGSFLLVMLVSGVFRGFVLAKMWTWFVVPLGVVGISIPHAIGLTTIIVLLTQHLDKDKDNKSDTTASFKEKLVEALLVGNATPAVVWGIGALMHLFM